MRFPFSWLLAVCLSQTAHLLAANPLETWHLRRPTPTSEHLNGVAFGNGLFVAVGGGGTVITSSNGVTWATVPSGTSQRLNTVTFAQGRFLIGGDAGTFLLSEDGKSWADSSLAIPYHITAIGFGQSNQFGGALYVAVGSKRQQGPMDVVRLVSTDSVHWATHQTNTVSGLTREDSMIVFSKGAFIATGPTLSSSGINESAQQTVSTDGTNWAATPETGVFAFDQNLFVKPWQFKVTATATTVLSSASSNPFTWPLPAEEFTPGQPAPLAVCFGNGRFVTVGELGHAAVSLDGTNWTAQSSGTDDSLNAIAFGESLFVAVGSAGSLVTSPDGFSWTPRHQRFPGSALSAVAPADEGFVTTGAAGIVAWSPDGINWTFTNAPASVS